MIDVYLAAPVNNRGFLYLSIPETANVTIAAAEAHYNVCDGDATSCYVCASRGIPQNRRRQQKRLADLHL